jgi:hypothetical protein
MMQKTTIIGLEFNKFSIKPFIFDKTLLFAYGLIMLAVYGVYEIINVRYFSGAVNSQMIALDPTNPVLKESLRTAVFGVVGEVQKENPWTLFIANYIYMIYTGSGIIFLVALAEVLGIHLVEKLAASFMVAGLAMVFAGLFTIAVDTNVLNLHWMFLDPQMSTGMWLMMPLYGVYIPFVMFEIYLILTKKRELAKKLALPVLVLSIGVDIIEYYIQARLFSMNTARHLWSEFPALMLYFIISAFVTSLGIMGLLSFFVHKAKKEYAELMQLIQKSMLFFITILAAYELMGYLLINKDAAFMILFGPFKIAYFVGYIFLVFIVPFLFIVKSTKPVYTVIASLCVIVGGYVGRFLFVYGGNANPLTNRFGTGFEKYNLYDVAKSYNFVTPHFGEISIVVGSVGVAILVYKIFDILFSVNDIREH